MKTFVHWFCKSNSEFMICRVLLILDNCVFDEKKRRKVSVWSQYSFHFMDTFGDLTLHSE